MEKKLTPMQQSKAESDFLLAQCKADEKKNHLFYEINHELCPHCDGELDSRTTEAVMPAAGVGFRVGRS
jgi:hypothetical protein